MQAHPFIESLFYRTAGIAFAVALAAVNLFVLTVYEGTDLTTAIADCAVTTGILATAGFLFWYVIEAVHTIQLQVVVAIVMQIICIAAAFIVQSLSGPILLSDFAQTLPVRVALGLLAWIVLMQWYSLQQKKNEEEEKNSIPEERTSPAPLPSPPREDIPERISVKDGSRIHLLHLHEILYIQASGDYLSIFTATGQYLKEETMKHFEQQFSALGFVRIHRSCIVNMEQIMRIELFGKETYQVRLKNSVCLRASSTGYKLLKERLSL